MMNGFSVPSRGIPYVSIHFYPALQCTHCPRSTDRAILDPDYVGAFRPECPIHGYAVGDHPQKINNDLARKQQRESITRFVLYMYDSIGYVVGISPVTELTSIPGYEPTPPKDFGYAEDEQEDFYKLHGMPDEAWAIDYVSMVGEHISLYVVWSWDYDQFFLYRNAEQINAPDHFSEWVDMLKKKREVQK